MLDTCTLIWLALEPKRLGRKARAVLDDDDHDLYLSDASVWELCLKWRAKKVILPTPPRTWLTVQLDLWKIHRLELKTEHFYRTTELPELHRDPFDRLLVAQALERTLCILTPDVAIQKYPVAWTW